MHLIPLRYRLITSIAWTTFCLYLFSCVTEQRSTLDQRQREFANWDGTAEIVTRARSEPLPTLNIQTPDGVSLQIPSPQETEHRFSGSAHDGTNNEASGEWFTSISTPLGILLIFLAIGIVMLALAGVIVWRIISKNKIIASIASATNQVWETASEMLADEISGVDAQLAVATDPGVISNLQARKASLLRKQVETLKP